ncbi:hypothetical protein AMIS_35190 [Actinoplanes missouriensis 431]|uniref:Tetratricopeptide repeat protein n=1 Tax=Actinoplanes missouriensis (strain ATCC 14538 / DSM 43046 / CBS 188.64 / JCM 3121 / NBRC 102363 / NCIMB 12654 / NRRL B-3342 / UNCC 431) TaxID=512565 RepID=I0H6V2_ACTM4|nr:hypothetical protein [Actinoplanes missouriensis]BAL88739.1 hypothetical protein AMIS_35190 [Actinoplanes missouriensis 431]
MAADSTMDRIAHGLDLHHRQGRPDAARDLFTAIWTEIGGERGDPLHVSVLAHAMADVQADPYQELLWDQRALTATGALTDDRLAEAGVPMPVAALYPSLHLNLAGCHLKLGDRARAREHVELARAGLGALADDDYGRLIRTGLEQLEQQL